MKKNVIFKQEIFHTISTYMENHTLLKHDKNLKPYTVKKYVCTFIFEDVNIELSERIIFYK